MFFFCGSLLVYLCSTGYLPSASAQNRGESQRLLLYGKNLVGYWPFDESTGDNAYDFSGFINHLYRQNILNASWPEGRVKSGWNPKGGFGFEEATVFNFKDSFTIMLWFRPLSLQQNQKIISKRRQKSRMSFYLLGLEKAQLYGGVGDGKDFKFVKCPAPLSPETWYHIAFTYSRQKKVLKLYLNGSLAAQESCSLAIGGEEAPLYIGADFAGASDFLDGALDELKIYQVDWDEDDIQKIYQDYQKIPLPQKIKQLKQEAGLIHYFPFDEGKGNFAYDADFQSPKCAFTMVPKNPWTRGRNRCAVDFDSSYALLMDIPPTVISYQPLTISAAIKIRKSGEKRKIVSKISPKNPFAFFFLGEDNGRLYGGIGDGKNYSTVTSATTLETGRWYDAAFVYDPDKREIRLFIDGVLDSQAASENGIDTLNASLVIGAGSEGKTDFFNGAVDEVRIYQKALTEQELKEAASSFSDIFHFPDETLAGKGIYSSLTALYDFDTDTVSLTKDRSGCQNNGKFFKKDPGSFDTGVSGLAFDNTGGTNSIGIPDSAYQREFPSMTLTLWASPEKFSAKQKLIIKQHMNNGLEFYLIGVDDGRLYGGLGNGKDFQLIQDTDLMDKGRWQHVALVIDQDKSRIILYRNGREVAQSGLQCRFAFSNLNVFPLVIGASGAQKEDFFTGKIDDVLLFSSALSAGQIKELSSREIKETAPAAKPDEQKAPPAVTPAPKEQKAEVPAPPSKKDKDYEKKQEYYQKELERLNRLNQDEKENQKKLEQENTARIEEMKGKLASREKELSDKENSLKKLIEEEKSRLEKEQQKRMEEENLRKTLEEELKKKNEELSQKIGEMSSLQNEIKNIQVQNQERKQLSEQEEKNVQMKIDDLKKQLEQQKEEEIRRRIEQELEKHNRSLASLKENDSQKQSEMQRSLQSVLDSLNQKQKELEEKEKQIGSLKGDIGTKNQAMQASLQSEKKKSEDLNGLIQQQEGVLSQKEQEITGLLENISTLKKQDEEQRLMFDQKKKELEAVMDSKQKQMEALLEQNEEKYQQVLAREKTLKETVEKQQKDVQQKIDELNKMHLAQLEQEKTQRAQESQQWSGEMEKLKKERDTLTSEIIAKEKERSQKLQEELDKEKAEKESLSAMLAKMSEEKAQLLLQMESRDKKIETEKDTAHQKQIQEYQQIIEDLKTANSQKMQEKQSQDQEMQLKISELQGKLSNKEEEISKKEEELKKIIEEEKSRLEAEKQKRIEEENKRKEMEQVLSQKNDDIKIKADELSSMKSNLETLRVQEEERLSSSKTQELEMQKKIEETVQQLRSKQAEDLKATLEQQLKDYQSQMELFKKSEEDKKKESESNLKSAMEELTSRQNELASKEEQISRIQKEISLQKAENEKSLLMEKQKTDELNKLISQKESTLSEREKEIMSLMESLNGAKKLDTERQLTFEQEKKKLALEIESKQHQMEAIVEKNEQKLKEYIEKEKQLKEEFSTQQNELLNKIDDEKKRHEQELNGIKVLRQKEKEEWQKEFVTLKQERETMLQLQVQLSKEKEEKEKLLAMIRDLEQKNTRMSEMITSKENIIRESLVPRSRSEVDQDDFRKKELASKSEYENMLQAKDRSLALAHQEELKNTAIEKREVFLSGKQQVVPSDIVLYWNFEQEKEALLRDVFTENHQCLLNTMPPTLDKGACGSGLSFADNSSLKISCARSGDMPLGISFSLLVKSVKPLSHIAEVTSSDGTRLCGMNLRNDRLFISSENREIDSGFTFMENTWQNITFIYLPGSQSLTLLVDDSPVWETNFRWKTSGAYDLTFGCLDDAHPGFAGVLDEIRITHSPLWVNKIQILPPRFGFIGLQGEGKFKERKITLYLSSDNAGEYILSETRTFKNAQWQKLSKSSAFTLSPDDGTKTLFVKFRNELKMESPVFEKKVQLIKFRPLVEIDSPKDKSYIPLLR